MHRPLVAIVVVRLKWLVIQEALGNSRHRAAKHQGTNEQMQQYSLFTSCTHLKGTAMLATIEILVRKKEDK